ncbi:MAG: 5-bromo-4-chloroindolyl phosphate hydrolysis family protein [Lachnospiraceae bacterium]|nr:5-bromo-4-chloroindolyl phosphate hydrolysis family protein [Lachnospiraceae bacterium]
MEVDKILDAGSAILEDVMTAVETNQYQDLGRRIQDRVSQATAQVGGRDYRGPIQREDGVYQGSVEPTNRKDGVFHPNYAQDAGSGDTAGAQNTSGAQAGASDHVGAQSGSYTQGAYSSDAYRRYSSDRRTGPNTPNSSSRSRQNGTYQGNQSRAGYNRVYGQYDYRNPDRQKNLKQAAEHTGREYHQPQQTQKPKGAYGQYDYRNPNRQQNMNHAAGASAAAGPAQTGRDFFAPTPFNSRNISKNTGLVPMVFGSIGMAMGGIGTLTGAVTAVGTVVASGIAALTAAALAPLLTGAVFTGASGLLFSSGKKKKDMVSDYYKYGKYVGNAEFFNIRELALKLGIQEKKLRKRLEGMKRQGFLPKARLDDEQEMLLLTDKAYDQYRQAADSFKKRQEEEEKRLNYFTDVNGDATVKELLKEGGEYLKKVRYYNDLIPDTLEMSNKLYRLENIMYRIFEQVKKKPEMAQNLRRFMEYYLPTTEKLLSAYIEVDKQPQVGDNITNTKQEIETAMDTINDAFEKLLDSLFEDLAWDISSDISVMKTMMQQDGLT